jgi:thymidine kinase
LNEYNQGSKFHLIAIDEIQFFEPKLDVFQTIRKLLENGYDVVIAGLALNFRGEPFGATLQLIGLCDDAHNVLSLSSRCSKCGKEALLPQRLIDGKPAPYNSDEIKVGGQESYEARCYECHELPGKPIIG